MSFQRVLHCLVGQNEIMRNTISLSGLNSFTLSGEDLGKSTSTAGSAISSTRGLKYK